MAFLMARGNFSSEPIGSRLTQEKQGAFREAIVPLFQPPVR